MWQELRPTRIPLAVSASCSPVSPSRVSVGSAQSWRGAAREGAEKLLVHRFGCCVVMSVSDQPWGGGPAETRPPRGWRTGSRRFAPDPHSVDIDHGTESGGDTNQAPRIYSTRRTLEWQLARYARETPRRRKLVIAPSSRSGSRAWTLYRLVFVTV